ncbi:MAG: winged helix-turn-helix transcriptional regulator [Candidatus Marinimicrobia bacterium]|nr:winged helix-turn-helix transcriptional regulator [Candidatus Neomarinimicrobiota bacterium]
MIDRSCVRSKVNYPVLESAQHHLESLKDTPVLAHSFGLLGDPTRLKILLSLAHAKELCVCDMADILEMETSAISHQLRKLRDGGLVTNQREGSTIYYQLASDALREHLATARSLLL